MTKSITPTQIKKNNRSLIYHYLYQHPGSAQQELALQLHLSRPTVASNLSLLESEGRISKSGQIASESAGRKAAAYAIVPDFRIALGVELLKNEVKVVAVNLYGKSIARDSFSETYTDTPEYYQMICDKILIFARALPCESSQILGIGFAMQALISADKKSILYGKILSCTGLSLSVFSDHLPWTCSFIHDAESAAVSELWASLDLTDAFYLSLSRHLGGSVIAKRTIMGGKHGHSGTIEHIHMRDNGIRCYCGQIGCMETLCSVKTLLADGETLESFFTNVRQGNVICSCRWAAFLSDLAECINLLHLVYDTDFILGGHLAPYLQEEDLLFLHEKIRQLTPFGEPADFLRISKMPQDNICIGAALPYIQGFWG